MNTRIYQTNYKIYKDAGSGLVVVANFKWLWKDYIAKNHKDYWKKKFVSTSAEDIFPNEK